MSPREERLELYKKVLTLAIKEGTEDQVQRELMLNDLFFLGVFALDMPFANNDWVFSRCEEFSSDRDGYIDLWPREHFKSTIITLWAAIQEILRDPEITIGIFSFNRPAAKGFLRAIKWQLEKNEKLRKAFPDILYEFPEKDSPKWSEDDGIVVKRTGLPKEMTVEAWGLVDGMPTGKHYGLQIYDDVVVQSSVTSPEMINKVTEAMSISFNLGKSENPRRWMPGTRYHFADTYSVLIRRGAVKSRIYAATKNGDFEGEPVLWSKETLAKKIRDMGTYVSSCQLFNNPVMEGEQTFKLEWINYWRPDKVLQNGEAWANMNRYIIVDPANEKKQTSDYTVMAVIGLGRDNNYYLIDMIRDKLSLQEKARRLFSLHKTYRPIRTGYEKYGMQADIDYIKERMDNEQYRFPITPLGGTMAKNDRIKRVQPFFEEGRFYLPERLMRVDYQNRTHDLIQALIQDEYLQFPYMSHDDMMDCISRIADPDMNANFPNGGNANGLPAWAENGDESKYDYDTFAYLTGGKDGY